jgi:hypothetical protein
MLLMVIKIMAKAMRRMNVGHFRSQYFPGIPGGEGKQAKMENTRRDAVLLEHKNLVTGT